MGLSFGFVGSWLRSQVSLHMLISFFYLCLGFFFPLVLKLYK